MKIKEKEMGKKYYTIEFEVDESRDSAPQTERALEDFFVRMLVGLDHSHGIRVASPTRGVLIAAVTGPNFPRRWSRRR